MAGFIVHLGYMSLQAVLIICVVLLVRKVFSLLHISKKYVMLLWMIPFFCLIFPWKISSPAGFWSAAPADYSMEKLEKKVTGYEEKKEEKEKLQQNTEKTDLQSDREVVRNVEPIQNLSAASGEEEGGSWMQKLLFVSGVIWAMGVMLLVFRNLSAYWKLKRRLLCSMAQGDIYFADDIRVPMALGIFKTKIYVPSAMEKEHLEYVVAHERTHIRRKDSVIKPIAYFITCIHWFNPVVWLAYYFMEKDMEMACDEETIQRIGIEKRKEYATALLQLSVEKTNPFTVPLSFGEGDTKSRIRNVLHYQKTVKLAAVLAVIAGIVLAAAFLTKGPGEAGGKEEGSRKLSGQETVKEQETGELTFEMVRKAFAEQTVDKMDFADYTNGEKAQTAEDDALNYYIWFNYEYEGEQYHLCVSFSKKTDALEDIDIVRISDSEMAWIYTASDKERYPNDLEVFLSTKTKIDDWLTLELPDGYKLGEYKGGFGLSGGALITPKSYQVKGESTYVPDEWTESGFVGRITDADKIFSFQKGELSEKGFPLMNHSTAEVVRVLHDLDWPAVMVHYSHDLYTAADMAELEEKGILLTETTSEYWYFFFAKEGEKEAYYLALSAKEFSEKEAVAIAKTVRMR